MALAGGHQQSGHESPYYLQLFGKLSARIAAGVALADDASQSFGSVLHADGLTGEQWGLLALQID